MLVDVDFVLWRRKAYLSAVDRQSIIALSHRVVCVQEACGFGYRFQRELEVAGAKSLGRCPSEPSGLRSREIDCSATRRTALE